MELLWWTTERINLIKKAADEGLSKAQYQYLNIWSKTNKKEETFEYLKKASYNCHRESMYEYGHELSQDDENRQETLYFLKNASDEGHIDALFEYGKNIIKKEEMQEKRKEVGKYAEIAANNDNLEATSYYGLICFEGIEKGNIRAINNYGYMLKNSGEASKEEVVKYFKMAADKEDAFGLNNYGALYAVYKSNWKKDILMLWIIMHTCCKLAVVFL